jgi:hypothetical protein
MDVAGVRRAASMRARMSAEDEYRTASEQFLVLQPSLDESWWKGWFGFDGATGALVNKTLREQKISPSSPTGPEAILHGGKRSP